MLLGDEFPMVFVAFIILHMFHVHYLKESLCNAMFYAGCLDGAWASLWNSSKAGAHTMNY